jgi:fatty-acyl-CoA synthase
VDYQLTVPAIIRRAAMLFSERPIVNRDGPTVHRYRYADMLGRAKQLAGALRDLGVRPGDRVATLAWNGRQHLEAYFAVPAMGAVLHTLNVRLHARDLAHVIEHAGDRVIIVDARLPQFDQVPMPACVQHVIVIGDATCRTGGSPTKNCSHRRILNAWSIWTVMSVPPPRCATPPAPPAGRRVLSIRIGRSRFKR